MHDTIYRDRSASLELMEIVRPRKELEAQISLNLGQLTLFLDQRPKKLASEESLRKGRERLERSHWRPTERNISQCQKPNGNMRQNSTEKSKVPPE